MPVGVRSSMVLFACVGKQSLDRLGGAKAGRCQGGAQVFLACWPAGDVLGVAVDVVPDVRDLGNVHGEQGEFTGDRPPAKVSLSGSGVTPLPVMSSLDVDGTADHDLALRCWIGDDAVQQDPRVAVQISRLGRSGHH